jgi:hypothetical protein
MTYLPHQQRVVDEAHDLSVKLNALRSFIAINPLFYTLKLDEQNRLQSQLAAMGSYLSILDERIEAFGSAE